ncbi:Beta-soluble NSF attachment protein [Wickerhamomyces ciferrii]|uniref:Beta-soluble NSF attachment protein n=1 Tax=Wickerhamomyces ciferrii (strain ATCC 14091 / BCRC 22168 / CBS 111 / JCM 3599 / NBRC 0793 / NRRL Y-1031 F-60-10) TaxID=1206466 RepID=K0KLS1_WICCF|nr:Beta-soluble NSF attachment protein [Wickerhamomyces ciferrii]CCH42269.1 Beta-soluble NSF attachment protein [Wickerhamomyces ciferrii]
MSDPETLIQQADKKAASKPGFFGSILGGSATEKLEEASDLYVQAANIYRLRKQGKKAGESFEKAADALYKAGNQDEGAQVLVDAFKSYKVEDPASAAKVLEKSIEHFTLRGQFRRAANYKMDLAQIYEEELFDIEKALSSYQDAGDWFESDSAQALANKAFLKAADLNALSGNYIPATEIYKKIVKNAANNNLSRWSLKDYFVKIVFSYLAADDSVAANKYIQEALNIDSSFQTTREYNLTKDVLDSVNEGDPEKLSNTLYEYDQFSKLDNWKTKILLKIKNSIVEADDDLL